MKDIVTVIFILLGTSCAFAQEDYHLKEISKYPGTPIAREYSMDYDTIQGHPFHNEDFIKGTVLSYSGNTSEEFMRYNAFRDEFEYIVENKVASFENTANTDAIFLNGKIYKFRTFFNGEYMSNGYLVESLAGQCGLLKRELIDFKPEVQPINSFQNYIPDRFAKERIVYYTKCNQERIRIFSVKKNDLKDIFGSRYEDAMQFVKQNKLKLRKEEDLIRAFESLNN